VVFDRRKHTPLLRRSWDETLECSIRLGNVLEGKWGDPPLPLIEDIVQLSEADLLRRRHLGRKTLRELKELLSDLGLSLGMDLSR